MFSIGIAFVFLFLFFGREFVKALSPGFSENASIVALDLVHVMALGIPFYVLCYLIIYYLNSSNLYGYGSLSAIIQNVILILILFLSYIFSNFNLISFGFIFTYLICTLLIIKVLRKNKMTLILESYQEKIDIKLLLNFSKTLAPLMIFMFIYQANIFVERLFTSKIGEGSIAAIDYARTLFETPTFLLVVPIATISLTYLSGREWDEKSKEYIQNVVFRIAMLLVPISIIFFIDGEGIIKLLFMRGKFNEKSLELTNLAMKGLSICLWALGINIFMQRAYNAFFRNKEFVRLSVICILINISLNFIFYKFLKMGIYGVTMAYSIAVIIQSVILIVNMKLEMKKILNMFLIISFISFISVISLSNIKISENYFVNLIGNTFICVFIFIFCYLLFPSTNKHMRIIKIKVKEKYFQSNSEGL